MFRKVGDAQSITKIIVAEEVDEGGVLTDPKEVAARLAVAKKKVAQEAQDAGLPLGETEKSVLGERGLAEMLGLDKKV